MDNRTNFVDKQENVFFKNVVDFGKLSDITKAEDSTLLLSLQHWVHIALLDNVLANDLGTCTSEHDTEKGANLDNGITDYSSLKMGIGDDLFFRGRLRVLCHFLELLHHLLDRVDDHILYVGVEEM